MAKRIHHFVKLDTKKIKRRYKNKNIRHRKKLGPKSDVRVFNVWYRHDSNYKETNK